MQEGQQGRPNLTDFTKTFRLESFRCCFKFDYEECHLLTSHPALDHTSLQSNAALADTAELISKILRAHLLQVLQHRQSCLFVHLSWPRINAQSCCIFAVRPALIE